MPSRTHRRHLHVALVGSIALLVPVLCSAQIKQRRAVVSLVTVPDVRGKSFEEARAALEGLRLEAEEIGRVESEASAGVVVAQNPQPNTQILRGRTVGLTLSRGRMTPPTRMPDLYGMTEVQAREVLRRFRIGLEVAGAEPSSQPTNTIIAQDPRAGEALPADHLAKVRLAAAPPPVRVVPRVTGMPLEAAVQRLSRAGLTTGQLTRRYHEARAGTVIDQYPPAGRTVEPRSPVNLIASDGPAPQPSAPQPTVVPDLRSQTEETARGILARRQLALGQSERVLDPSPAGLIFDQNPPPGTQVPAGTAVGVRVSTGGVVVPDVTGRTQEDAAQVLADSRLKIGATSRKESAESAGRVIAQSPPAGTLVNSDATVALDISSGPAQPAYIEVPNVIGMTDAEARAALEARGLQAGSPVQRETSQPAGTVVDQNPAGGSRVAGGKLVQLLVSAPPQTPLPVIVPDVIGERLAKAANMLADQQLNYAIAEPGSVSEDAIVSRQSPRAYERVQPGTTVRLELGVAAGPKIPGWVWVTTGLAVALSALAYVAGRQRGRLPRLRMSVAARRDYGLPHVAMKMSRESVLDLSLGFKAVTDPGLPTIRLSGSNLPRG